jgi:predicted RNA-binding Zn ribbon-like protein
MTETNQVAPGPLEVVRTFVNTRDIEDGTDELAAPGDLARWLSHQGLATGASDATPEDLEIAIRAREALRALLWANGGEDLDPRALRALNEIAARTGMHLHFESTTEAGLEVGAPGVIGALGRLLTIVADAMNDGTWSRLKACSNETCGWAFYDHARNRSGKWCSMAVCGNRMKARAFRARQAEAES